MLQVMDCVYELVVHKRCNLGDKRGLELLIFEVQPRKWCVHLLHYPGTLGRVPEHFSEILEC